MPNNMQEVSHALMRMVSPTAPGGSTCAIAKTRAIIGPPKNIILC